MGARLAAPEPTDRSMWRRLMRVAHPDAGGDHDLFIWTQALFEHVSGDRLEDVRPRQARREPPPHRTTGERIDFTAAFDRSSDFADLTRQAVAMAESAGEPYARLLKMLAGCYPAEDGPLHVQQHQGATYRQLAYIAHLAGLSDQERYGWYEIAKEIPLSQRHASHLIAALRAEAA